jgi:hypothetical protein
MGHTQLTTSIVCSHESTSEVIEQETLQQLLKVLHALQSTPEVCRHTHGHYLLAMLAN